MLAKQKKTKILSDSCIPHLQNGWEVVARPSLCQMIKKEGSEKDKGGDKKEKSTGGHKQRQKHDTWIQSPGFSP